ncbi:MAG: hypothetical protein OIF32_04555 [Campylobacterales bacterium]|nr:hypothetical protein [Campylobacterales bacterium]
MKKILITLLFAITTTFATEVKVMFANSLSSETSEIQPYTYWYLGSDTGKTSLKDMYAEGWRLVSVVKLNAIADQKQFWLFLEK